MNWVCPDANGWNPKLAFPWLAYGNRGEMAVVNLLTEEVYRFPGLDVYPHGWISPDTLRCTRLLADDRNRHLYDLAVPAFGAVEGAQTWRDFSEVSASFGHWAAWDGSGQVLYDGQPLGGGYHGVRQSGEWVAARGLSGDCLYVYHRGVLIPWSLDSAAIPGLSPMQDWTILGSGPLAGTVVYGRPPNVYAAYLGGTQKEVSRSPWREGASYGGLGSGLQLLDVDGVPWLWSVGAVGEDVWGCLGGVLGEREVVTLPIPAVALSAQVVGGKCIVAVCDDRGRCQVQSVPVTAPRTVIEKPAPPPPVAILSLDRLEGTVPFTVHGRLAHAHLRTWRWLLNGAIHQPIDGDSHTFILDQPGVHSIGLRTDPAVDVSAQFVTAQPAPVAPPPTPGASFRPGVQVGFGDPVGLDRLRLLKTHQWEVARIGIHHQQPDRDRLLACIQEVQAAEMTPLVLLPVTAQVNGHTTWLGEWVPDGLDVSYYGPTPDPTTAGQEADNRGEDPVRFAEAVAVAMIYHRAHGHRVWAPELSNPSKRAFAWLERFVAELNRRDVPDVGISIHRYPDYGMRLGNDGRRGFTHLRDEILELKRIIGGRPWAMNEGNWHTDWMWKWPGDFFKWFRIGRYRLTDAEVVANTITDWRTMRAMGCRMAIWYQVGQAADGWGEGLFTERGEPKHQLEIAERL